MQRTDKWCTINDDSVRLYELELSQSNTSDKKDSYFPSIWWSSATNIFSISVPVNEMEEGQAAESKTWWLSAA